MGKGRTKNLESRAIVKYLLLWLNKEFFPHVFKWTDKENYEFFVLFMNKRNKAFRSHHLDLFKALDSISPAKAAKYRQKPDFDKDCKKRCHSNLQKLCSDHILELKRVEIVKDSIVKYHYKFLELPNDYLNGKNNLLKTEHSNKKEYVSAAGSGTKKDIQDMDLQLKNTQNIEENFLTREQRTLPNAIGNAKQGTPSDALEFALTGQENPSKESAVDPIRHGTSSDVYDFAHDRQGTPSDAFGFAVPRQGTSSDAYDLAHLGQGTPSDACGHASISHQVQQIWSSASCSNLFDVMKLLGGVTVAQTAYGQTHPLTDQSSLALFDQDTEMSIIPPKSKSTKNVVVYHTPNTNDWDKEDSMDIDSSLNVLPEYENSFSLNGVCDDLQYKEFQTIEDIDDQDKNTDIIDKHLQLLKGCDPFWNASSSIFTTQRN